MKKSKIPLSRDTINAQDLQELADWLLTIPRLTKGNLTIEFEKQWAKWTGCKYSIMVNSGSSANLAMLYACKLSGRLKNNKIIVPALSWSTTVSPLMHLGFEPILCDTSRDNLGIDVIHLQKLIKEHNPAGLILVHILGLPCDMKSILQVCKENDVVVLEDSCESVGSKIGDTKTGNFGLCSTFSMYFGHHISTIEGGMICTNDEEIRDLLLMIRSHGWDRDLSKSKQDQLRKKYNISDFHALYTFYVPSFNLRATDLQAKLGLGQMKKIDEIVRLRNRNYILYDDLICNEYWKPNTGEDYISALAYPVIHPNSSKMIEELQKADVEIRPLVCGSIGRQPFWYENFGHPKLGFANIVHDLGFYLPNNHELTEDEIRYICDILNKCM